MQFKCLDELPGGLPVTRCTRIVQPTAGNGVWMDRRVAGAVRIESLARPFPGYKSLW